MIHSTDLVNKNVISLFDCKSAGTVDKLYIGKNWKCDYIGVHSLELDYLLSTKDILSCNYDSIVIGNNSVLKLEDTYELRLTNYMTLACISVYDFYGKYLGKISQISLDDKYKIVSMSLDNSNTITPREIFNISSSVCILKGDKNKSVKSYKPKTIPKINIVSQNYIVKTESEPITHNIVEEPTPTIHTPSVAKSIPTVNMLIGRICTKDITLPNGEIIVRRSSKINSNIIHKSQIYGKLYELVKYSKIV